LVSSPSPFLKAEDSANLFFSCFANLPFRYITRPA
jgi:hypothetical protein